MWLSAARVHRNVPFSVTSSTIDHCSSVISCSCAVPPRPALFTSTSIPPSSDAAAANNALHVVFLRDVARHAEHTERGRRLAEPPLVLVADHDPRALLLAALRGRRTRSRSRPRRSRAHPCPRAARDPRRTAVRSRGARRRQRADRHVDEVGDERVVLERRLRAVLERTCTHRQASRTRARAGS